MPPSRRRARVLLVAAGLVPSRLRARSSPPHPPSRRPAFPTPRGPPPVAQPAQEARRRSTCAAARPSAPVYDPGSTLLGGGRAGAPQVRHLSAPIPCGREPLKSGQPSRFFGESRLLAGLFDGFESP